VLNDLRQALRQLRKAPGFTATAVITLALGIGATTAIFTLVDQVMLRSLPVTNPQQLWRVGKKIHCCGWGGWTQSGEFSIFSYDLYKLFRDHTPAFEELAAFEPGNTQIGVRRAGSNEQAQTRNGEFVSGNFFETFGVQPWIGRLLTPADDHIGATPVAVLSYHAWELRYGKDPNVLGTSYLVDGHPFTVVGVAAPGFYGAKLSGWGMPDFWLPVTTEPLITGPATRLNSPNEHFLDLIGRVKPGTNPAALEAQLRAELHDWQASHVPDMVPQEREVWQKQNLYLTPGGTGVNDMRREYEDGLKLLFGAAGCVLLVACANLANLMLARGLKNRQQTSVRVALGASRKRLVRRALVESVTLGVIGGALGVGVAYGGARLVLHLAFQQGGSSNWLPVSANPSWMVLLFTLGLSIGTGVDDVACRTDRGAARSARDDGQQGALAAEGTGHCSGRNVAGVAERSGDAGAKPAQPGASGFRVRAAGAIHDMDEHAAYRLSAGEAGAAFPAHRRAAGCNSGRAPRRGSDLRADERRQLERGNPRGGAAGAFGEGRRGRELDARDAGIFRRDRRAHAGGTAD